MLLYKKFKSLKLRHAQLFVQDGLLAAKNRSLKSEGANRMVPQTQRYLCDAVVLLPEPLNGDQSLGVADLATFKNIPELIK
ncbi:hypothetical protein KDI_46850 [Dictyobacter arantiisoli]|uniref:Uncharacterized protein n=1 Tax=Dictyobacter arantiisoli TaxID=2014874 RepID=A0A5A5THR1_9CHLR|nr:hypothetical protein KDI_46850 [Dictyobacter arantiisoli]